MPPSSRSAATSVSRSRPARLLFGVALAAMAIALLLMLLTEAILPWALRQAIAERGVEVGRVDVSLMRQEVSIEGISFTSSTSRLAPE